MNAFLITYKPESENRERGWPIEELQRLVNGTRNHNTIRVDWRFRNRKDVSTGDRVFLLVQGKLGPAIIGYGRVAGPRFSDAGIGVAPIEFEFVVDPTTERLAGKEALRKIDGAGRFWRINFSGVRLPKVVAAELEAMVAGQPPKKKGIVPAASPPSVEELKLSGQLDERRRVVTRREQAFLRKHVLRGKSSGQCVLCGQEMPIDLLVAAHIKPRARCSDAERRDLNNIVPMCLLGCDALFERGYAVVVDGVVELRWEKAAMPRTNRIEVLRRRKISARERGRKKYFEWHAAQKKHPPVDLAFPRLLPQTEVKCLTSPN